MPQKFIQLGISLIAGAAVLLTAGAGVVWPDGAVSNKPSGSIVKWETYANDEQGYEIKYPKDWEVIEAGPVIFDAAEEIDVLFEDEIQKVTFLEKPYNGWRGMFQVRVLVNPDRFGLEQWVANYNVVDEAGEILINKISDIELDKIPAKKLFISGDGYKEIEIITVYEKNVYSLIFIGENPKDSHIERHKQIYDQMLHGFTFTQ